jgi:hypothetical protein
VPPFASLPAVEEQAERLIQLGIADLAGIPDHEIRRIGRTAADAGLLSVHPDRAPASMLTPMLHRAGRQGFVVVDMDDVDEFVPIHQAAVPTAQVYLVTGIDRGDEMSNWSPDEALASMLTAGRTPLTLTEGILWLLQQPAALERNHCFMTIGSRRTTDKARLDARTPAIWISNGTGRDGSGNRDAPKVGWCWAGNRHTWLGFASASGRHVPATSS